MPDWSLYLSPHFDDLPLSCGGTVAMRTDAGERALLVTVFSAGPSGPPTDFALFQHVRWGLDADDVLAARREEERQAAAILGAETSELGFPDAIYRDDRYTSDEDLFGSLHRDDLELVDTVIGAVEEVIEREGTPPREIYVPLGAGNHVDHQLLTAAGQRLAASYRVLAYEDYPYAGDPGAEAVTLARAERLSSFPAEVRKLTPAALDRRLRAILCYRSQLSVIFRHQGDPVEATTRFASHVGSGEPAERFWLLAK